jgi:hypothetical protein
VKAADIGGPADCSGTGAIPVTRIFPRNMASNDVIGEQARPDSRGRLSPHVSSWRVETG